MKINLEHFIGIVVGISFFPLISCWNEWDYTLSWHRNGPTSTDGINIKTQWGAVWNATGSLYFGDSSPPRPRRGHSLHIVRTDPRSEYQGDTYVVLFGGRDNNQMKVHIPKTYEVVSEGGTIRFETYDKKPVNPCNDPDGIYYSAAERAGCGAFSETSEVNVALSYNDVWAYKLCPGQPLNASEVDPTVDRSFDGACESSGWEVWHVGAREGGCVIELGIEVCTVPSERYNHGSVMFNDGCLYVYGGFSERCADFCDDVWFFDIYMKSWRQIYDDGALTKFYSDLYFSETVPVNATDVPVDNSTEKFAGPSKRWRHTMSLGEQYFDGSETDVKRQTKQAFALYGGHRLWHGYSPENSEDNNWSSYLTRPRGGYLDDLWIYTKVLDDNEPKKAFKENNGKWVKKEPVAQCYNDPGVSWDLRDRMTCKTVAPVGRAGHGSAYDTTNRKVWIFGGYNTYFPYLSTDGVGSGAGVTSLGSGGFVPYPGYQYFRNDLWYFDLDTNVWVEVVPPEGSPVPDPRMDMVFLLLGDIIFMHGGFADNFVYGDAWYFNITTQRWLEKNSFVRPIYAANCTDDLQYIEEEQCTLLQFPKLLQRSKEFPFEPLPYEQQEGFWPNRQERHDYFGIFPKGFSQSKAVLDHTLDPDIFAPYGTPMFPYAATGTFQYAKNFSYSFNATFNVTMFESCTSVFGEPTRGRVVDGLMGRSNGSVFIAQRRPQKPGWDGCRDRNDQRADLPVALQYVQPLPRYSHRAVYNANTSEILFYGGLAYTMVQAKTLKDSYELKTRSDFWYYNLNHCVNNCSSNGDCFAGFCHCYSGYYGVDCSNVSCPGTFCYYDPISHEQICSHACSAGYRHTDLDVYVQDIAKLPCSLEDLGESNGICDGFGSSQCAPPFVGDDCSIKDCKSNCSFNGWCSVEYPVSRCMCGPGFFGEICDQKLCLNNCSYPNGVCNTTSGHCNCNMMYSPYNNTREYKPWGGEDCSYLFPYAAGSKYLPSNVFSLWYWLLLGAVVALLSVNALVAAEGEMLQCLKRHKSDSK